MFLLAFIYTLYGALHILVFKKIDTIYGSLYYIEELRFVANFTIAIINLYIIKRVFFRRNTEKLKKSIGIMLGIYCLGVLIPVILNISPSTYSHGIGKKGFFETGNALSAVLLISNILILTMKKVKTKIILFLTSLFILIFLIGSRAATYGAILNILVCIFAYIYQLILYIIHKKNLSKREVELLNVYSDYGMRN